MKSQLEEGIRNIKAAEKALQDGKTSLSHNDAHNNYVLAINKAMAAISDLTVYLQRQEEGSKEMLDGDKLFQKADRIYMQANKCLTTSLLCLQT